MQGSDEISLRSGKIALLSAQRTTTYPCTNEQDQYCSRTLCPTSVTLLHCYCYTVTQWHNFSHGVHVRYLNTTSGSRERRSAICFSAPSSRLANTATLQVSSYLGQLV